MEDPAWPLTSHESPTTKEVEMTTTTETQRDYEVDSRGFLIRPEDWDERFAERTAPEVGITSGLTDEHWRVIRFVRAAFEKHRQVPLVYVTCVNNRLKTRDLKRLFPAGYHRGVCRLAGVSYRTDYYSFWIDAEQLETEARPPTAEYRVDAFGFLIDHTEWDPRFAINKARELKMPEGLTAKHWRIIHYLRDAVARTGELPTVTTACEDNDLELEDLWRLFPDGYHRGAVKVAGLRFV
jgi:tRNA 2-thiouridine synthesizing protein E